MRKACNSTLCICLSLLLIINCAPMVALASTSSDCYAKYTGSTTASYGYKPDCTFTIDKIVDNKFRGSFSATNLGAYNVSQNVEKCHG